MATSLAVPRLGAVCMSSNKIESQRSIPLLEQVMIAKNSSTLRQKYRGNNTFEQDIIARPYIASSEMMTRTGNMVFWGKKVLEGGGPNALASFIGLLG